MSGYRSNPPDSSGSRRQWQYHRGPSIKWLRFRFWLKKFLLLGVIASAVIAIIAICLIPNSIPPLEVRYNAIDHYEDGRVAKIVNPGIDGDKKYFQDQEKASSEGAHGRKTFEFIPNGNFLPAIPFREFLENDVFKPNRRPSPLVVYLSVFGQVREAAEVSPGGENGDGSSSLMAGLVFTDGGIVTIKEILDLAAKQPRPVLFCLDVTRARTRVSAGHFAQDFTTQLKNEYEAHPARKNAWILCAANEGEWSWAPSTSQPSAFVKSIVDGLLGAADSSSTGGNSKTSGNERVEVGELFSYVQQQTRDWALRYRGVEQTAVFLHPEASNWDALVLTTYSRRNAPAQKPAEVDASSQTAGAKDVKKPTAQEEKTAEKSQPGEAADSKKEAVAQAPSEKKPGAESAEAKTSKAEPTADEAKKTLAADQGKGEEKKSLEAEDLRFPILFSFQSAASGRFEPLLKAKLTPPPEAQKTPEKPAAPGDAKIIPPPDPEVKKLEDLLQSDLSARREYQVAAWKMFHDDLANSEQPVARYQKLMAEIQEHPQHPPEFDLANQLFNHAAKINDPAIRKRIAAALTLEARARQVVLVENRVARALEERKLWSSEIRDLEIHRRWIWQWLLHGWDGKEPQERDRVIKEVEDRLSKAEDLVKSLEKSGLTISAALRNLEMLPSELFRYASWVAPYSDYCLSGQITTVTPTRPDANPYGPIAWSEDSDILTPLSELFDLYRQLRRQLSKGEANLDSIIQLNDQIDKSLVPVRKGHAQRVQRAMAADDQEVKGWHVIDRMLGDPGLTHEQEETLKKKQQKIDELRESSAPRDRLPGNFTNTTGVAASLWGIQILTLLPPGRDGSNADDQSLQNLWVQWKDSVNAVNMAAKSDDDSSSKSSLVLQTRARLGNSLAAAWNLNPPELALDRLSSGSQTWRSRITELRRKISEDSRFVPLVETALKVEVGPVSEVPGSSTQQQRTVTFRQKKTERPSIRFAIHFDPSKVISVWYRDRSHSLSTGERFDETWENTGDGEVQLPLTVVQERAASAPDAWLILAAEPYVANQEVIPPQVCACRIPGITDYSKWQVQFKAVPRDPAVTELIGISLLDKEKDKPVVKMFLPPVSAKGGFQAKAFLIRPVERSSHEETVQLSIFRMRENQKEALKEGIKVTFPAGPVNDALDSPSVLQEIPFDAEPEKPQGAVPPATPPAGAASAESKPLWDRVDEFTIELKLAEEPGSTQFQVMPTFFDVRQANLLSVRAIREGQTFSLEYNIDSESHLKELLRAFYPKTIPVTTTLSNAQNLIDSQQSESTSVPSVKKMDWQKFFEAKFLNKPVEDRSTPRTPERETPLECSVNLGGVPQQFLFRQVGTSREFEMLMRPQLRIISPKNGDCFERGKPVDFKFEVDELDAAAAVQLELDGNLVPIDIARPRHVQIAGVENGVWTLKTLKGEFAHKLTTDFLGRKNLTATLKTGGKTAIANVSIGVDTPMDSAPQIQVFSPYDEKSGTSSNPLPRDKDVMFKIEASDPQSGIIALAIALDKNGDEKLGDDEKVLVERKYDLAFQQGENWEKPRESLTIPLKILAAELGDMPSDENKVLKFVARATNGLKQVNYRSLSVSFRPPPKPLADVIVRISNCPKRSVGVEIVPANGSKPKILSRSDDKVARFDRLPIGKYKVIVYPEVSPENLFQLENPMDAAFELTKEHTSEHPHNVHVIIK